MRAAFAEIIDYAGLFPPASCTMDDAARQFDVYRNSADRWMLGRFILPATRLDELASSVASQGIAPGGDDPWRLSVVIGANAPADLALIGAFAARSIPGLVADAVEVGVTSAAHALALGELIPGTLQRYFEVPSAGPYHELVAAIRRAGAIAKIRTGGMTPDRFPATGDVVFFLQAVIAADVPFKATAGLHHPFRGRYPLSYAPDADRGVMHGFVNLLAAVAGLMGGGDAATAAEVLESPRDAFRWSPGGLAWRDTIWSNDALAVAHRKYFTSFGSCSFREPVDELGSVALT